MSKHAAKFSLPLFLAVTTLAAHTGSAAAADPESSMQQQVIEFVAGNVTARLASGSERLAGSEASPPNVDAQEFARELLSGTLGARAGKVDPANRPVVSGASGESQSHFDVQAMMRQVLLGRHSS